MTSRWHCARRRRMPKTSRSSMAAHCASWPMAAQSRCPGHLDCAAIGQLAQGAAMLDLDVFGILRRRAQCHRDVIGDLVAGNRYHSGMADRAAGEYRDVGGAAADVHQAHAQPVSYTHLRAHETV